MAIHRNLLLCLVSTFVLAAHSADAQRVRTAEDRTSEESAPTPLKSKIWFGGGIQLGFQSFYGSNVFSFGLSPMVGYKIVENLSVGPRVEINYASIKQPGSKAENLFDVDAGIFTRFRIFRGLFVQGELSNEWYQDFDYQTGERYSAQRFNQRLGAGWNFGNGQGGGASEIGVFYNLAIANDLDSFENPLGYRFGFTWNF